MRRLRSHGEGPAADVVVVEMEEGVTERRVRGRKKGGEVLLMVKEEGC